jgi:uncharacterized protein
MEQRSTSMKGMRFVLSIVIPVFVAGILIAMFPLYGGHAATPSGPATATTHTISTWGHADIAVKPDQASLMLGVQTRAAEVRKALSNNNGKMDAVIAALVKQGVAKTHIQTTDLSVWYDTQQKMYVVAHNLSVRLDRIDKVAAVLEAGVQAGVNSSFGVTFGLKDPAAAKSSALKAAVADARKRADSIAETLGAKVSQTVNIDEATSGFVTKGATGMGGGGTPIQPGQYVVSADVNVTYTCG